MIVFGINIDPPLVRNVLYFNSFFKPLLPLAACSKPTCPKDQDCRVDAQGRAVCECPKQCPSLGEPVCGSNGKTYENECIARKESCEKKKGLSIKPGSCGK